MNQITEKVIGSCIEIHRTLGPGLLESAYLAAMAIDGVIVSGEHATSTLTIRRRGVSTGPRELNERVVQVWRKSEGRWRILHEQTSPLAAAASRAAAF